MEATVRQYGEAKGVRHWPSPYTVACGVLLALSFLKVFYHPLQWLAVAAAAAGLPPIIHRSLAAARRLTLDINILMLIAGTNGGAATYSSAVVTATPPRPWSEAHWRSGTTLRTHPAIGSFGAGLGPNAYYLWLELAPVGD